MEELFWVSVAVLVQTYVAFPLVTIVRGRLFGRDVLVGDITPSISVVIAAHDEATSIGPKLHSVLDADYPVDLVEVIVASDGSADGTPEAAAIDPRVRVLVLPRVGKAAALNAAITASRQDVLVFTDANSRFAPDALRKIVRPLADPEVGGVAGDQRYEPPAAAASGLPGSGTVDGERRYWDFDRILKEAESAGGNVIGATGALYAVRRELVGTVPEGVTDDFTTSTGVIEQGHRLVFAGDATVFEPVAASTDAEFRRKVRVMTRGLAAVAYRRRLLDPRAGLLRLPADQPQGPAPADGDPAADRLGRERGVQPAPPDLPGGPRRPARGVRAGGAGAGPPERAHRSQPPRRAGRVLLHGERRRPRRRVEHRVGPPDRPLGARAHRWRRDDRPDRPRPRGRGRK